MIIDLTPLKATRELYNRLLSEFNEISGVVKNNNDFHDNANAAQIARVDYLIYSMNALEQTSRGCL